MTSTRSRWRDSPWPWYAGALGLACLLVVAYWTTSIAPRPVRDVAALAGLKDRDDLNVLMILIDTLRADRLGSYGYSRNTSPVLDSLAASGVRFARVEAQSSWTKCSMASLWTALVPTRTGVTRFSHVLAHEATSGAERLHDAGFRTAGIWRNGWVANNFGFDQGFDLYFRPTPSRTQERFERRSPGTHPLQGTDWDATEAALAYLRARGHERFFLYVHYMDVHQYLYDQVAADLEFGTDFSDAYDSAIHWVDRNVGLLLDELAAQDLARETIVVVASDHGEGFYEHGREFHARTLYREVTEVPLLISLPFRLEGGIVVEELVRNLDLWPTLLDLLGLEALPEADGRSLVPLIHAASDGARTKPEAVDAFAFLDLTWGRADRKPLPLVSVRSGPHRLLFAPGAPGRLKLFDHSEDPWEQVDVSSEQPTRTAELRRRAEQVLANATAWGEAREISIGEMERGQLRALGYVVDGDRPPAPRGRERAESPQTPDRALDGSADRGLQ